jgi:hypothetical protein
MTTRKRSASSIGCSDPLNTRSQVNTDGLLLLAQVKSKLSVVPSSKNYFGGFKVSHLMIDDGCSSHLIVLDNLDHMDRLFEAFPPDMHKFIADISVGTAGTGVTMEIKRKDGKLIPLNFCRDLLPGAPDVLNLSMVRIMLGTRSELDHLVTKHGDKLSSITREFYQSQLQITSNTHKLKYSLIGYSILEKVCSLRAGGVAYYFHPTNCTLFDVKRVLAQDDIVNQHLLLKTSLSELQSLKEELENESARKGRDNFDDRVLCLWTSELSTFHEEAAEVVLLPESKNNTLLFFDFFRTILLIVVCMQRIASTMLRLELAL